MKRLALIGLIVAYPALAEPVASTDAPPGKEAKVEKTQKVCKRFVPTGSIMPVKICRTEQQWRVISDVGQDVIHTVRLQSQSTLSTLID